MNRIIVPGASRIEQYLNLIKAGDQVFVSAGIPDIDWAGIAAFPFLSHSYRSDLSEKGCADSLNLIRKAGGKPFVMELPQRSAEECFEIVTEGMCESSKRNILRWLGGTPDPILEICRSQACAVISAARLLRIPVRRA